MSTITEVTPTLAQMHTSQHAAAVEEFRYQIKRRDDLNDRIRFGLLGLNGASLVGLVGLVGSHSFKEAIFGLSPSSVLVSASSFALGLVLAGWSVFAEQNVATRDAGRSYALARKYESLSALHKQTMNQENFDRLGEVMKEAQGLPLTGFRFSHAAIVGQHFSAGAWLFGLCFPVEAVFAPFIKLAI